MPWYGQKCWPAENDEKLQLGLKYIIYKLPDDHYYGCVCGHVVFKHSLPLHWI